VIKHDHIALAVTNFEKSLEFYLTLGARVVSKPSDKFVEIVLGDVRLHLILASHQSPSPSNPSPFDHPRLHHLCLAVDSLTELQDLSLRLNNTKAGQKYGPFLIQESPPLGPGKTHSEERPPLATLYFRDPDGIGLEARCYR
jgi:catechol 2,3-dioxygenase-like lactoylglutathione lyase family enzyme